MISQKTIPVNWNVLKENVIIVGSSQEGKTHLATNICATMSPPYNFIVFTPHKESELAKINVNCIKHNVFDVKGEGLEIVIPIIDSQQFFDSLCEKVFTLTNVVFVMDELHNYCSKYQIPKPLGILLRNCNNRNISYVAIFQRPQEVPSMVLSNSNHRYCFYLDLFTDVDYMKEFIGMEMEKFKTGEMPKYHGLYRKKGTRSAEIFTV